MDDIIKNQTFGKVVSNIDVIEFQKRGLPHAHILILLDKTDKPKNVDDYDKIVSAEMPDKTNHQIYMKPKRSLTFTHHVQTSHCVLKMFVVQNAFQKNLVIKLMKMKMVIRFIGVGRQIIQKLEKI